MFFNLFALPVFLAVLLGFVVAVKCYGLGNQRGERFFGISMAATSVYGFFYALELSSSNPDLMVIFLKLQYLGAPFIIPYLLLFALRYANKERSFWGYRTEIILIVPVFVLVCVLTNSAHGLAYTRFDTVFNGYFEVLTTDKGAVYYLHVAYTLVLTLIADLYLFMLLFTVHRYFFWRVFLVFSAITLTWLVYVLHLLGVIPLGLDAVPFMFLVTGLLLYAGLVKVQIFDVIPAAHRQVFQRLNQGLLVFDHDDRLISANPHAEQLLELNGASVLMNITSLEEKLPGLSRLYQDPHGEDADYTAIFDPKSERWLEISIQLFGSDRKRSGGKIITLRDITPRRTAEIEREQLLSLTQTQNERLQQFAHITSHNLRSHCTNLTALISFLEEDDPSLAGKEDFRLLRQAAVNLQESVSHLSEVARIHTAKAQELSCVSVNSRAGHVIAGLTGIARKAGVTIINNLSANLLVWGIPAYIDSILMNLICNGIRFRSDNPEAYVKLSSTQKDGWIIIHVEDNGLGIDLERNQRKLFGMFNTFHNHPESRGIGLFLSKAQSEAMNGMIEVQSTPGKGSTFHLWLHSFSETPGEKKMASL